MTIKRVSEFVKKWGWNNPDKSITKKDRELFEKENIKMRKDLEELLEGLKVNSTDDFVNDDGGIIYIEINRRIDEAKK